MQSSSIVVAVFVQGYWYRGEFILCLSLWYDGALCIIYHKSGFQPVNVLGDASLSLSNSSITLELATSKLSTVRGQHSHQIIFVPSQH